MSPMDNPSGDPIPKDLLEAYDMIAAENRKVFIERQKKYGPDNISAFGEYGVLVRSNDKIARLKNATGKDFADESVNDSWLDLSVYGIIARLVRRGWWGLPFVEPPFKYKAGPVVEHPTQAEHEASMRRAMERVNS